MMKNQGLSEHMVHSEEGSYEGRGLHVMGAVYIPFLEHSALTPQGDWEQGSALQPV